MNDVRLIERRVGDHRVDLILNVPRKRNALSGALIEELGAALQRALQNGVCLIVLKGEGPTFCGGLDLDDVQGESDGALVQRFAAIAHLLDDLVASPCATVAIVQGRAVGAGADLAMACDIRVALPGTQFSFPGPQFGLVLGTGRLAEIVGHATAMHLALTGSPLSGDALERRGAAITVQSSDEADSLVTDLAASASRLPPGTVQALRMAARPGTNAFEPAIRSALNRPSVSRRLNDYVSQRNTSEITAPIEKG
jgi:enoyl-CoA hydratase